MKEQIGDIWLFPAEYRCITTNGIFSTKTGCLVMGRGIAKEAKDKYPALDLILGQYVKRYGNRCFIVPQYKVISFPTKNDWKDNSSLKLIEKSTKELVEITDKYKINSISLPKPGCGCGNLNYKDVKPILEKYLDNRFTIFSN